MKRDVFTYSLSLILFVFSLAVLEFGVIYYYTLKEVNRRFATNFNDYPKPATDYTPVQFMTTDGVQLAGWYLSVPHPKAVIVLVHRYDADGAKAEMLPWASFLTKNGYSCLVFDMRAYGASQGDRSWSGIKEWRDLEAAYNYVKQLPENTGKKIGFFGRSIGGVISIIAAGKTGLGDFVIAVVPFATYEKVTDYRLTVFGASRLPFRHFFEKLALRATLGSEYAELEPEQMIQKIHQPLFLIWSDNDEYIGLNQGSELFKRANEPKEEWRTHVGHNIGEQGHDADEFEKKILSFLERNVVSK